MTTFPNAQNNGAAAIPVWVTPGPSGAGFTPRAGTVSVVTTGGTAVTAIAGPINGGYILNPPNAASQGISAAENLYVDMVSAPGSTDATANGTTTLVPAGGNPFVIPAIGAGVNVQVNAASNGHKFTIVWW